MKKKKGEMMTRDKERDKIAGTTEISRTGTLKKKTGEMIVKKE